MFVKKLIVACVAALAWSGAALAQPTDSLVMRIKGMRCDESAHKVMKAVSPLEGVRDIRFNLERRTATVYYEAARITPDSIRAALGTGRLKPSAYSPDDVIKRGCGIHLADLNSEAQGERVMALLRGQAGVDSLAPHPKKRYLFVRYDANRTNKATLRQHLLDAGFTPTNYYTSNMVSYLDCTITKDKATPEIPLIR